MNRRLIYEIIGIVLIAGAFLWLKRGEDQRLADWKQALHDAKVQTAIDTKSQQAATVHYDTVERNWVTYRDRILRDTVHPATPREREIIAHADTVRLAADTVIKRDTVVIHDLRVETKIAEHPPGPKRFTLYVEPSYDLLHAAPTARAGADVRLFSGLSATTAIDLTIPPAEKARARALVGIRYTF